MRTASLVSRICSFIGNVNILPTESITLLFVGIFMKTYAIPMGTLTSPLTLSILKYFKLKSKMALTNLKSLLTHTLKMM